MTVGDEGEEAPAAPRRWRVWRRVLIVLAVIVVPLTLINASWLATRPPGRLIVVANRGIAVPFDHRGLTNFDCTATRIQPPGDNPYIENTLPSLYRATRTGADAVNVQVQPTKDGQMVVFHDADLDCRTNGHGSVRDHTLAELKRLDVGYGYTADGGRTYPFRGKGIDGMPTVEELLREIPTKNIIFVFKSKDPGNADALVAAFRRAGVAFDDKYGFAAAAPVAARIRQLVPGAWVIDDQSPKACIKDYLKIGWTGITPSSCRNTTVIVPLNDRWMLWGWPYRFLARMANANTRVVIWGAYQDGNLAGLNRPEQYDQVPADFHGWLMVDDFYTMGPALQR
ncbi:MAG TPA: glycerophosphodiester phosphodiesterase family protein [Allosphingosinicella sp.]|jgi:glycerophosphoryl diester phosphodiesterase|nr:glycerophosphodiester phosphodiesterase family protein [Allosphingosinicella sp.]